MALSIKDRETDRLARQLAQLTGEPITAAVKSAIKERLEREARHRGIPSLEELMAIARRCAARPVQDERSEEEILGYDERGLPR